MNLTENKAIIIEHYINPLYKDALLLAGEPNLLPSSEITIDNLNTLKLSLLVSFVLEENGDILTRTQVEKTNDFNVTRNKDDDEYSLIKYVTTFFLEVHDILLKDIPLHMIKPTRFLHMAAEAEKVAKEVFSEIEELNLYP